MVKHQRRRFLAALAAAGIGSTHPAGRAQGARVFGDNPFKLGVASGYPTPDGAVLWTRLLDDPARADGGLPSTAVTVGWELAADEKFAQIVARGMAEAEHAWAHSVHVEPVGLASDRWYWYRFTAGGFTSPVGRVRTAPAAASMPERLRFAFASCQMYEQGWFSAYRQAVRDELDLMIFLGDYIYESSWGRDKVRFHSTPEPYSLADYRVRYAQYKSDPDLMTAHRAMPWVLTWDDHEVDNDYANDRAEDGTPRAQFLERRAAAYRAFYEHQPLPARMRPNGPDMRIYTRFDWGALASFFVLDGRQYRDPQACPTRAGGSTTLDPAKCAEIDRPERSMLGAAQEAWLDSELAATQARWNVIAQQTLMARFDRGSGARSRVWTDGWDGYPAARRRLLGSVAARKIANPVVIGGDVHMHMVADLRAEGAPADGPVLASEFVCNGITSQGPAADRLAPLLARNPHVKYARSEEKGYVRMELTRERLTAEMVGVDNVKAADTQARVIARFEVESGRPGARQL